MNILYYANIKLSKPSAERTHVSEVVNNMARLGHKVYLLTIDNGNCKLHKNVLFHKLFPIKEQLGFYLFTKYILMILLLNLVIWK